MRIQQNHVRTIVAIRVGIHLIEVVLLNSLFRPLQGQGLPLRIQNPSDLATLLTYNIWLHGKCWTLVVQVNSQVLLRSLQYDLIALGSEDSSSDTSDVLLKEHVHVEEQREGLCIPPSNVRRRSFEEQLNQFEAWLVAVA